jgi:hypothetical protein
MGSRRGSKIRDVWKNDCVSRLVFPQTMRRSVFAGALLRKMQERDTSQSDIPRAETASEDVRI